MLLKGTLSSQRLSRILTSFLTLYVHGHRRYDACSMVTVPIMLPIEHRGPCQPWFIYRNSWSMNNSLCNDSITGQHITTVVCQCLVSTATVTCTKLCCIDFIRIGWEHWNFFYRNTVDKWSVKWGPIRPISAKLYTNICRHNLKAIMEMFEWLL